MQRITIRYESGEEDIECSLSREDIVGDDMFWMWFTSVWMSMGLSFITDELEKDNK
jgi:hypothetical protein